MSDTFEEDDNQMLHSRDEQQESKLLFWMDWDLHKVMLGLSISLAILIVAVFIDFLIRNDPNHGVDDMPGMNMTH